MRNYFADNAAGAGPTVLLRNVDGLTAFGNVFEDPPPDSGGPALRCEATPGFRARGHTFVNTHFEHHQWSEWQMHDVTAVTVLGGRLRPQFTWDQVPPGRERRWFEANAGSAGVTRGLGQIVVSSSGSAAHDPDAAARLAPLLPDGAAHDAISSGTALVHRQSYRAFWARTTAGAPVEIARSGVLQGGGSSVAPESRWRVSLGAQDQASRAVKLEVTGGKGDLVVYGGSTEVDAPGRGIILVSASGRARMRLGIDNNGELALTDLSEPGPTWFIRGDTGNGDLLVDLSDVIVLLRFLFLGGQTPVPMEGGDANADADVDLLDPIYLLAYLFLGGAPPPPPFPDPGAAPAP
jgi:hypothetical protein